MRTAKTQAHAIVLPGSGEWELWKWGEGSKPDCRAGADAPAALDPPGGATICLPVGETASAAFWLATGDAAMVPEMAALQVEAMFPDAGVNGGCARVASEDRGTLIFTVHAPAEPACLAGLKMAGGCVPVIAAFPFAGDSVTVLRELGALIAVVTRDTNPVAMVRLARTSLDGGVVSQLRCLLLRLEAEGVSRSIGRVVVWDDAGDAAFAAQLRKIGLECEFPSRPLPKAPSRDFDLMPPHFKQTIRSERGRRKLRTAGAALSAVAGLVLVWFLGRYAWMEWDVRRMEQTNAELRPGVEQLREAAAEWELLEPAVQPDAFALEWLHRFASRLPDKGVRITLFQLDEKGVFLTGEADRAARVVNYQDGLDSAPELAALELTMPPPKILANNIARFEVTARRKGMADVEAP